MRKFLLIKVMLILLFCVSFTLIGCNEEDLLDNGQENNLSVGDITFNDNINALSINNREHLRNIVKGGMPIDKIIEFYEEGFVPKTIMVDLDDSQINRVISAMGQEKIQSIIQRNNNSKAEISRYENDVAIIDEDNLLIRNEEFSSVLNSKNEIIVNDTIFRYTEKGVLFTNIKNYDKLDKINLSSLANENEGLNLIDDVHLYVPYRAPMEGLQPQSLDMEILPYDPDTGGGSTNNPSPYIIPENLNYVDCTPSRTFIDNIFGKEYSCEYKFNRKKKLRTIFAVEDYYLFFDVYAQAKFKQKKWLGWFSDRDASTVFLQVDKANLKFKRRGLDIKIGVKQKDLIKFYKDVLKYKDKLFHLSNEINEDGSGKSFLLSEEDVKDNYNDDVIVPRYSEFSNYDNYKYSKLFNEKVNKILVINLIGINKEVTDEDIYKRIYDFLKSKYGKRNISDIERIAIIIKQDNIDNNNNITSNIASIDYGRDLIKVHRLAVARKSFKFPKEFEINSFEVGYSTDIDNPEDNKIKVNVDFGWNAVKAWNVRIKSGALYQGKWGGSKFEVIKD